MSDCPKRSDGAACCLHEISSLCGESVCCWCGDIFGVNWADEAAHGEYLPKTNEARVEELSAELERLRAVLRQTHERYCTEAWMRRGKHAWECLLFEVES